VQKRQLAHREQEKDGLVAHPAKRAKDCPQRHRGKNNR